MAQRSPTLSLADAVCLAVVGEQPSHGWAIVKLLAPDGELGRIWTLSRPLTYRSLAQLEQVGLVARRRAGRRSVFTITAAGRRARRRWLDTPVAHLRDLRTEFLLKLTLRDRAGLDRRPLVERQIATLDPAIDALTRDVGDDPVELWRHESALAAHRFLTRLAGTPFDDGTAGSQIGQRAHDGS